MREISGNSSFNGLQPLVTHFGLGDATNVETLRIEWPSGIVQELQNVPPKQIRTIVVPGVVFTQITMGPVVTCTEYVGALRHAWERQGMVPGLA
jgi:hypothetical protein